MRYHIKETGHRYLSDFFDKTVSSLYPGQLTTETDHWLNMHYDDVYKVNYLRNDRYLGLAIVYCHSYGHRQHAGILLPDKNRVEVAKAFILSAFGDTTRKDGYLQRLEEQEELVSLSFWRESDNTWRLAILDHEP